MKKIKTIVATITVLFLMACSVQVSHEIPLKSNDLTKEEMILIFKDAGERFYETVSDNQELSPLLNDKINFNASMSFRKPVGGEKYFFYSLVFLPDNKGKKINTNQQQKLADIMRDKVERAERDLKKEHKN